MIGHKHEWHLIYSMPGGRDVRQCRCGLQESRVFDYQDQEYMWIKGNIWVDDRPIFILAGNWAEFAEARQILMTNSQHPVNTDKLKYISSTDVLQGIINPTIVFWGRWWENGILEDPRMTFLLNNRR